MPKKAIILLTTLIAAAALYAQDVEVFVQMGHSEKLGIRSEELEALYESYIN